MAAAVPPQPFTAKPALLVPAESDVVWRYVRFLDLVPMIEHSQLPLIRLDQFGDKYEASIPTRDFWQLVLFISRRRRDG